MWPHMNFKIIYSISVKMSKGIFDRVELNFDCFGKYDHFDNINSANIRTWSIFPFLYTIFNFHFQCLIILRVQVFIIWGASQVAPHLGKKTLLPCRRCNRYGFNPWVRKIPWSRKQQPTLILLSGESQGQRSLEVYSP